MAELGRVDYSGSAGTWAAGRKGPAVRGAQADPARAAREPAALDKVMIDSGWEQKADWKQMVQDCLNTLAGLYKGVDLSVATFENRQQLREYAASLGPGMHLVVSDAFLEKMASGAEAFLQGKALLEGLMKQMDEMASWGNYSAGTYVDQGRLINWLAPPKVQIPDRTKAEGETLFDKMREAQEKALENLKKMKKPLNRALLNSPMQIYSKLSKARNVRDVKGVVSAAQHKIYLLKVAYSLSSGTDKEKVRVVLAQMQKAVARAGGKVKDLRQEDELRRRQRHAEEQLQRRQAMQIRAELQKRQAARKVKERGHINECVMWDFYMAERERQKQILERQNDQLATEAAGSVPSAAFGAAAPAAGFAGVTYAASDVVIGDAVPIAI